MADREPWFVKLELELATGRTIKCELTRDETLELAQRFFVQEDPADDLGLTRAAFTTLLERIEARTGELVLPSGGQIWILPATSVVALGFEHRVDVAGRARAIEVGFRGSTTPVADRQAVTTQRSRGAGASTG